MREYVGEYEEHLRARHLTPGYIQSMRFQLDEFFGFLDRTGDGEITRTKITAFQNHLKTKALNQRGAPLSPRLLSKRLYAVSGFFRWLTQRRLFLLNPARDLGPLKTPHPLPAYIPSHETLKQMIESIPKTGYGLRDRALLELLYSTGVRAGELLSLTLYDLDLEGRRVLIRKGKGAKDRVVPLGEKAFQALQDYLSGERPRLKRDTSSNALFLTRSGKPVTYPALIKTLQRYRPNPGIRPHTIRHATALGMLKKGADIRFIQELLGHEHLETTQIYTRLLPQDLQLIHKRYHPRERTNQTEQENRRKNQREKQIKKATQEAIVRVYLTIPRPTTIAKPGARDCQGASPVLRD